MSLLVEPKQDWEVSLRLAMAKLEVKDDDVRKIFVYDACGRCDRPSIEQSRAWRTLPPFDASHFERSVTCIFSEPEKDAAALFGPNDLMFAKDGRRATTSTKMTKVPRAACKGGEGFHHFDWSTQMTKFGPHGYASRSNRAAGCGRSCAPDLLETGWFVSKRTAKTPHRPRKYINLPGDNSCRGLSSLGLRSEMHYGVQVSLQTLKLVQEPTEGADLRDEFDAPPLLIAEEGEEDEGEAKPKNCKISGSSSEDLSRAWFPWAVSEMFWREFLNCYGRAEGAKKTIVVDLTPGCGMLALAAARSQTRYVGFALNQTHVSALMETLQVAVAVEIARNSNDGFLARRVLSRAHSLGGSTDADVTAEEARKALEKQSKDEKAAAPNGKATTKDDGAKQDDDEESSSDESSD